jgi:hypothetical protein
MATQFFHVTYLFLLLMTICYYGLHVLYEYGWIDVHDYLQFYLNLYQKNPWPPQASTLRN